MPSRQPMVLIRTLFVTILFGLLHVPTGTSAVGPCRRILRHSRLRTKFQEHFEIELVVRGLRAYLVQGILGHVGTGVAMGVRVTTIFANPRDRHGRFLDGNKSRSECYIWLRFVQHLPLSRLNIFIRSSLSFTSDLVYILCTVHPLSG